MTILSTKMFGGEVPRAPVDKLPEGKAQQAVNCNFAYGELRSLKQPFLISRLANAAKSIFSVDGLTFYSWPFRTKAWKGPVIDDVYNRMYYTGQNGGLRTAQTTNMRIDGGEPAYSYKVGVPPVTAAPAYQLVDRTTLPDYQSVSVELYSLYQLEGKRYDERAITSFTTVAAFREYTFYVPPPVFQSTTTDAEGNTTTVPGLPQGAVLTVRVDVKDAAKGVTIFSLTASVSSTSARSDAVPGGVEARLLKNGSDTGFWKLSLTYGIMETRAYVVTMVNDYLEESKPSPPVIVQPTYMQEVKVTFVPPSFSGYVPCSKFRLYRSVGSGDYLSVNTSPQTFSGAVVTATDPYTTLAGTDAVLETIGWDEPPTGLRGLTLLPNGFFAGFVGDTLYFSEPYRPWAWPHSMTFPVGLVGLRAMENSLVVTTKSAPYLVSGVHPEAMTQSQLTQSQAGISDHGMAVVGNTVAYLSNDGLAVVKGYEVDLSIGQQLWTREIWKEKFGGSLSNMELAYHDGSLVCSSTTAGKMWEIRLDSEGGGNLTMRDSATTADALYVLPVSDQLYTVQGNNLYQYNGGATPQSYDWWSKEHILPKPTAFTAGYINTDGPVIVRVYADGQLWHTVSVVSAGYFRLPSGKKALRWSYRLQGTGNVKEISLAERRQELTRV